jgi:23S rRNA (guanosine2251-2'-O)-methyltransferase
MLIFGLHPVLEALRAGRVRALRVSARADDRMRELLDRAASARVPVERVDPARLDREAGGGVHQGVIAEVRAPEPCSVADLVNAASGAALIVVLDGIEDPHNTGAIVRSADAAGADGVVRQSRRSAPLAAATAKASAGAVSWVRVAEVVNMARVLEELKALHVWTVGLAGDAVQTYDTVDFTLPTAIVLGAEGAGLRRLVRQRCDLIVSIPMAGRVDSLNVSVAAGVVLFEAARQRRRAAEGLRRIRPLGTEPRNRPE